MRSTLLIFAKEPLVGLVKTRLVPPLTPEEAAQLADAFLGDLLERLETLPEADVVVALPSDSSRKRMAARFPQVQRWADQGSGGLGERLARAFDEAETNRARGVLVVGSDHPNLPLPMLERCLESLRRGSGAWILTEDGGYAAIGLSRSAPQLFQDVPWSTSRVADVTRRKAAELGIELDHAGTWYDVDRSQDLSRLDADLSASGECPRTRALFLAWRASFENRGILPTAPPFERRNP